MAERKKSKKVDKRRFSDEQIRCLEVMFESETKLDPRKKVEVARELGLQPRQVAIWFQNKRARWKSNHLQKEYSLLLSNYNNLTALFDSLNKENHSLLLQLQKLKNELKMGRGKGDDEKENEEGEESESVKTQINNDLLVRSNDQLQVSEDDDDDGSINAQLEFLRMVDTLDWGTATSLDSSNCWDFC